MAESRFQGLYRKRPSGAPYSPIMERKLDNVMAGQPRKVPQVAAKQNILSGIVNNFSEGYFKPDQLAGEQFQGSNPAYAIQGNNAVTSAGSRLGLLDTGAENSYANNPNMSYEDAFKIVSSRPDYNGGDPLPWSSSSSPSLDRLVNAVAKLESGNDYKSVGKTTKSGDRAYGFSQVMGANIPSWTKESLGYSMTPQEYLNNPEAQKAVTKYYLGKYLEKYGNIEDAAAMWFSGRPASGNTSRDVNNTSVPEYIRTIKQYY